MLFLACFSDDSCTESVLLNMDSVHRFYKNKDTNPVADTIVETMDGNTTRLYYIDADILDDGNELYSYVYSIPES